jgi:hypothetical protein
MVTSNCAIRTLKLTWFFQLFTYMSPQFFFPDSVTLLLIWQLRTNSINFSSISEGKNRQHLLQANTRKCSGGDARLFTLSESSRYRPVRTRSVTSNIHARQRRRNWDATETFLSVWTSPFNYTCENFTGRLTSRDGTETWRIVWMGPKSYFRSDIDHG